MKPKYIAILGSSLIFGGLLFGIARQKSLVFDEVIYPAAGVDYWKTGKITWNMEHPPLQKLLSALPLISKSISLPSDENRLRDNDWRLGYRFFFKSPTPAPELVVASRIPTILITILLGAALFWFGWNRGGWEPGVIGFLVFALDPLVLGNGCLGLNDSFLAAFAFFALLTFDRPVICGLFTGAAIGSKLSGLYLYPAFALIVTSSMALDRAIHRRRIIDLFIIGGVSVLVVGALYKFNLSTLAAAFSKQSKTLAGAGNLGFLIHPLQGGRLWFYYPVAVLIKTPLPLLFLWVGSIVVLWNAVTARRVERKEILFWTIPLVFVILICVLVKNLFGMRYLLPAVPIAALLVGTAYRHLHKLAEKIIWWGLVAWLALESLIVYPNSMTYFNEIAGGSSNGYKWLDGSNQDWGQDLPALANYLKKELPDSSLLLGYSGASSPEAWGIRYQDVLSFSINNSFHEPVVQPFDAKREILALSARMLREEPYAWIRNRQPQENLGNTIFIYDISRDLESVVQIANIYSMQGRRNLLIRQLERALYLDPKQPIVEKALKDLRAARRG